MFFGDVIYFIWIGFKIVQFNDIIVALIASIVYCKSWI